MELTHKGTKPLETSRLLLRPFVMEDALPMFRNYANDPEVTKFLCWQPHGDVEETKGLLAEWIPNYEKPDYYFWAICPKETGEPIGGISIVKQEDRIHMVQAGYCIGKKWWNQGYTSEALQALIDFFFKEVGINRFEARHDPNNPNSGKVMEKCGMTFEGINRQADRNNQGICDVCMWAVLREDWDVPTHQGISHL